MSLTINLRHLEIKDLHLNGEMSPEELEIESRDELIQPKSPLKYDLAVQSMESNLLVTGQLTMPLDCLCSRCLKPHQQIIAIPNWAVHIPLVGDEAVPVNNDTVDLTPILREDILLEFPQHPLCEAECSGLPQADTDKPVQTTGDPPVGSSAWNELNKLKL